jgi:hypothetical protein
MSKAMFKTMVGAAAATASILVLGVAPATADSIGVRDPLDTFHGSDLRSVHVKNGEHKIVVTTTHEGLRRDPRTGSGGAVYLDTDRSDRGPEYVFVGGYFRGTDYALLRTEGFGARSWGDPVEGSYGMRVDYDAEQVRMRISRKAIDEPGRIRVAVRVSGTRTDGTSHGLVDWLGEPRSFTRWVAQG